MMKKKSIATVTIKAMINEKKSALIYRSAYRTAYTHTHAHTYIHARK